MPIRLRQARLSPDVFSVVMATGILSIGARQHHYLGLSETLGALTVLSLLVLIAVTAVIIVARRPCPTWNLGDVDDTLRLFTFVAAGAVLYSRMPADPVVSPVLAAVTAAAWLLLTALGVRNTGGSSLTTLRDRVHGAWLLASVGTSGLAIMAAQPSAHIGHRPFLILSGLLWAVAIGSYLAVAALIVARARRERLDRAGFEPDSWILMGALAIAVLAGHHIGRQMPDSVAVGTRAVTVVIWLAASLWIPPLIYFGLHRIERRPALLQFTGAWWTLVFPLGMYSAATHAIALETNTPELQTVSLVFFWVAMAVWLIVGTAGLLRIPRAVQAVRTPARFPASMAASP